MKLYCYYFNKMTCCKIFKGVLKQCYQQKPPILIETYIYTTHNYANNDKTRTLFT